MKHFKIICHVFACKPLIRLWVFLACMFRSNRTGAARSQPNPPFETFSSPQSSPCFWKPRVCFPALHEGVEPQFTRLGLNETVCSFQRSDKLCSLLSTPTDWLHIHVRWITLGRLYFLLHFHTHTPPPPRLMLSTSTHLKVANRANVFGPGIAEDKDWEEWEEAREKWSGDLEKKDIHGCTRAGYHIQLERSLNDEREEINR